MDDNDLVEDLDFGQSLPAESHQSSFDTRVGMRGKKRMSFIWKYVSKVSSNNSKCNLCNKLMYSGGGNTTNIARHLRRCHADAINKNEMLGLSGSKLDYNESIVVEAIGSTRRGKGSSYVWRYCEKISKDTIVCRLCHKTMSFHGTANVITHLQRKHNITGPLSNNAAADEEGGSKRSATENGIDIAEYAEPESTAKRHIDASFNKTSVDAQRSTMSASGVWKYCDKLNKDAARCKFCNKILSFQGTSNLQRHLHRMHGVVVPSRHTQNSNDSNEDSTTLLSEDVIWQYFKASDDGENAECDLCASTLSRNSMEQSQHLIMKHGISANFKTSNIISNALEGCNDDSCSNSGSIDDTDWFTQNEEYSVKTDTISNTLKKEKLVEQDDVTCSEIDFENHEPFAEDEEPFDPNAMAYLPIANALSPQTSGANSPDAIDAMPEINFNTERLRDLKQQRLRMETEYFREKAAYYRMQKYFVALQAKKCRLEYERLTSSRVAAAPNINCSESFGIGTSTALTTNAASIEQNMPATVSYTVNLMNVEHQLQPQ